MSEKVTVVGSGYVGMSLAVLLAQHNDVTVLDIDPDRVGQVNRRESTVADPEIEVFLKEKELSATLSVDEAYSGAEFVVVATPYKLRPRHKPVRHEGRGYRYASYSTSGCLWLLSTSCQHPGFQNMKQPERSCWSF